LKIRILSPWKQDGPLKSREDEYLKRLKRYASLEVSEIKGEKGESTQAVEREGEKLLDHVKKGSFLVVLTEGGQSFDSVEFSKWLEEKGLRGRSDITFIVGGAAGIGKELAKGADMKLSLSPMTFPHQLARVILVEQIYRALTIIKGEPYHK
jgi:23S rRNA (pseudouridine1915-N3)-methyltransferase